MRNSTSVREKLHLNLTASDCNIFRLQQLNCSQLQCQNVSCENCVTRGSKPRQEAYNQD